MTGTSGARAVLVAADRIEAKIVEAEKLRTAVEQIRRLHAPREVCESCGDPYKPHYDGDCGDGGPLLVVCTLCCFDGMSWSEECQDGHDHVGDTTEGAVCSTTEIIARAGL